MKEAKGKEEEKKACRSISPDVGRSCVESPGR